MNKILIFLCVVLVIFILLLLCQCMSTNRGGGLLFGKIYGEMDAIEYGDHKHPKDTNALEVLLSNELDLNRTVSAETGTKFVQYILRQLDYLGVKMMKKTDTILSTTEAFKTTPTGYKKLEEITEDRINDSSWDSMNILSTVLGFNKFELSADTVRRKELMSASGWCPYRSIFGTRIIGMIQDKWSEKDAVQILKSIHSDDQKEYKKHGGLPPSISLDIITNKLKMNVIRIGIMRKQEVYIEYTRYDEFNTNSRTMIILGYQDYVGYQKPNGEWSRYNGHSEIIFPNIRGYVWDEVVLPNWYKNELEKGLKVLQMINNSKNHIEMFNSPAFIRARKESNLYLFTRNTDEFLSTSLDKIDLTGIYELMKKYLNDTPSIITNFLDKLPKNREPDWSTIDEKFRDEVRDNWYKAPAKIKYDNDVNVIKNNYLKLLKTHFKNYLQSTINTYNRIIGDWFKSDGSCRFDHIQDIKELGYY